MTKRKRIIIMALTLLVAFVIFYSVFFIAAESHHNCIGKNCPICLQIQTFENILKTIFPAATVTSISLMLYAMLFIIKTHGTEPFVAVTLISLKVKLTI